MKRLPILAIMLSIALAQVHPAQSSGSPNSDPNTQTKQDRKAEKPKDKERKAASKAQKGNKGKKATSIQDVAYALAYKFGIPKV
jgi:hypothetical protein